MKSRTEKEVAEEGGSSYRPSSGLLRLNLCCQEVQPGTQLSAPPRRLLGGVVPVGANSLVLALKAPYILFS